MAVRPFLDWPDRRLQTPAAAVGKIDDAIRELWRDLLDTMYAMPGVGLAAPQIGDLRRVAVVDCSGRGQAVKMADPEIVRVSENMKLQEEGSPNLPGLRAQILRPEPVTVTYLDPSGNRVQRDFSGLWAASVQHQIDHMNGIMFFDRLSRVKRRMLLAKSAKLARRSA